MRRTIIVVAATVLATVAPTAGRVDDATAAVAASTVAAPLHVRDWVYYGGLHQNEDVPPAWLAAHVDFAEADAGQPEVVERFKSAGGRATIMYTDPSYVPYCHPPFVKPAGKCDGPIGRDGVPESAWLHTAEGERVRREDTYTHLFQEILNPADPAAREAYRHFTAEIVQKAPNLDYFLADDSGEPLRGGDRTPMSGFLYKFNAPSVELGDDDERYAAGEKAMLGAAARPVIVNGGDPATLLPSYDGAFLRERNVAGATLEGCFVASWFTTPVSDAKGLWTREADALLAIARYDRFAVCLHQGPLLKDPAARLYGYASWLLTYDERHSVLGLLDGGVDGHAPFADEALVPREPLRSVTRVEALRDTHGAYAREFRSCFYAGRPLGPCAAVVNPSAVGMTALPIALQHYHRSAAFDARSAYGGGSVHFVDRVPSSLAPVSAALLFR